MANRTFLPHIKVDPIYTRIWRDIFSKDKNKLIFVCGGTGDCKSGSSITMSNDLDRDYLNRPRFYFTSDPHNPKNRIVTSAQAFIQLISTNLPKGSCIIWDEIGVDADNREYYSLKNRLVKKVFQTFRYKNLIVFMTVPDFNSVDIGVRKLAHGYLEMHGQAMNGTMARGKFQWLQTNPKTGKIYYKFPRWIGDDGSKNKLVNYYIKRPPAEMEETYKLLKDRVNKAWYKDFNQQLNFMKKFTGDKIIAKLSLKELEEEVMKHPLKYWDVEKEKFVDVLLEAEFDLVGTKARSLAKYLNAQVAQGNIAL